MSAVHSGPLVPGREDPLLAHDTQARAGSRPTWGGRPFRVLALAVALVAMSLVDLHITLLYLTTVGLAEENPVARWVMSTGSPGLLSAWKLASIVPTVAVIVAHRHRLLVELLAWVACGLLMLVMLHWLAYADQTELLVLAMAGFDDGVDPRWVTFPPSTVAP